MVAFFALIVVVKSVAFAPATNCHQTNALSSRGRLSTVVNCSDTLNCTDVSGSPARAAFVLIWKLSRLAAELRDQPLAQASSELLSL